MSRGARIVAALAGRWTSLVQESSNGNLGIAKSVATMYQGEPVMRQKTGLDSSIMEYISRARAFGGLKPE